ELEVGGAHGSVRGERRPRGALAHLAVAIARGPDPARDPEADSAAETTAFEHRGPPPERAVPWPTAPAPPSGNRTRARRARRSPPGRGAGRGGCHRRRS